MGILPDIGRAFAAHASGRNFSHSSASQAAWKEAVQRKAHHPVEPIEKGALLLLFCLLIKLVSAKRGDAGLNPARACMLSMLSHPRPQQLCNHIERACQRSLRPKARAQVYKCRSLGLVQPLLRDEHFREHALALALPAQSSTEPLLRT